MRIKMLRNKMGSPDGFTVKHYAMGQEYDVPESLAATFFADKDAEKVQEKAVEAAPANKAIGKAPKNKSA